MDDNVIQSLFNAFSLFSLNTLSLLLLGLFIIWSLNWLIRRFAGYTTKKLPLRRLLILQIATLTTFTLYIAGGTMLLVGVLQPPKEFLIAIGGSAAVAFGFALKDVAASLVAGLLLLFDRPFRVGDRVSFDGLYGEIVSIGLRTVRLQTLDDNLVTIPNSRFITEVAASANAGALDMMVVSDFHIALDADIDLARQLIEESIVTSRFAYLKKPVTFAISEVAIAQRLAIQIRAKAYVLDVQYEKAFQTDIVTRVAKLFSANKIARP